MWLMWLVAAHGAGEPVLLTPGLPTGRAVHWSVEQAVEGEPPLRGRATWEVTGRDDRGVELKATIRAPNPFQVMSLVWPEFVSTTTEVVVPGDVPHGDGPPITLEDAAFGSCAALPGLWVVLPDSPQRAGDTWEVGAMSCTLRDVQARSAQIECAGSRDLGGRQTGTRQTVERRLWFDLDQRLLTRCEASLVHAAPSDSMSWSSVEVAEGTLGPPDPGGCGCNRPAGFGVVALLAALATVLWRRKSAA